MVQRKAKKKEKTKYPKIPAQPTCECTTIRGKERSDNIMHKKKKKKKVREWVSEWEEEKDGQKEK